MAVYLQITSAVVGAMSMFEFMKQQGRSTQVPTYRMILSADHVSDRYFAVTRDASEVLFGDGRCHYGENGECPPSRLCAPYRGVVHGYGRLSHAIRLYEPGVSDNPDYALATVRGVGTHLRRGVLIHGGPARSEGCFTMENYAEFRGAVDHYLTVERSKELIVHVLPRHFGNENPLSSQ